jgi:small subunit ribosomal protein S2
MRQLLEAGVHFGHQTHRWNPKMAPYIYGARNNITLSTSPRRFRCSIGALQQVSDTVAKGGRILFVGTKRQASDVVGGSRAAQRTVLCELPVAGRHAHQLEDDLAFDRALRTLDTMLAEGVQGLTKKERLTLTRERDKLDKALGGIKDMGGIPDLIS